MRRARGQHPASVARGSQAIRKNMKNRRISLLTLAALAMALTVPAFAEGPDINTVVTAGTTIFASVAGVAITILTFRVGARLVSKFLK